MYESSLHNQNILIQKSLSLSLSLSHSLPFCYNYNCYFPPLLNLYKLKIFHGIRAKIHGFNNTSRHCSVLTYCSFNNTSRYSSALTYYTFNNLSFITSSISTTVNYLTCQTSCQSSYITLIIFHGSTSWLQYWKPTLSLSILKVL